MQPAGFDPIYLELLEYKKANDTRDSTTTNERKLTLTLSSGAEIDGVVISEFNETCDVVYASRTGRATGFFRIRIADISAIKHVD
jgi:hypothetical protein